MQALWILRPIGTFLDVAVCGNADNQIVSLALGAGQMAHMPWVHCIKTAVAQNNRPLSGKVPIS